MNSKNLTNCPNCGHDEFYRNGHASGSYAYYYRFDGEEANNGNLHDGLTYKENKTCFCSQCHLSLGIIEVKPQ